MAAEGFAGAEEGKLALVLARAGMARAGLLAERRYRIPAGVVWRARALRETSR